MNSNFKHRHHHISFLSALFGIYLAITSEINMKLIILFTIFTLLAGFYLRISYQEWLFVLTTIIIVFLAEMVNTSIEAVTDLVTKEWREDAKIAKDVSGGMVLVSCIGAFIIGMVIFLPKVIPIFFALGKVY